MEIAVVVNENADNNRSYGSLLNKIDIICIIAPRAKKKIELDDLFMKNTTSGISPRLKIKTRSGIKPLKIVP